MRGPLSESPRPLAEEPGPDLSAMPVFGDWTGVIEAVLPGPAWSVVEDEEAWKAQCREVRRPAAPRDFGRHVVLVLRYVDPDWAVMQSFGVQVAGARRSGAGTEVWIRRFNSSFAFDAVHHAGTRWRLLVLPRSALPLRVRLEDVRLR
jgi:hypothetical protein